MMRAWCLLAAALPLAAQPKLLVNAQTDTRPAAPRLEEQVRALLQAQPQPAWIGYSVPAVRKFGLGCDYVRPSPEFAGSVHLEPPSEVVILFRVEANRWDRIRTVSPDCEIDAGGLPFHWLTGVPPEQSIALLQSITGERLDSSALSAISWHDSPEANTALEGLLAPAQPPSVRQRAISALSGRSGKRVLDVLAGLIETDHDAAVRRRAISSLGSMRDGEGIPTLIDLARKSKDVEVRKQAVSSLAQSHDPRAIRFLEEVLK